MDKVLFGNRTAGLVLLFLERYEEVYATQIAQNLDIPVNMVQKQLERFERGGIIKGVQRGRQKVYRWNRAFVALRPLRVLLARLNAAGADDAADGGHLSIEERIERARSLNVDAEKINPYERPAPFARSFGSFESYEAWRKKQKNPWLI